MTNEQSFFLQILSDHLNGRETTAQADVDWPALLECAQNHQVSGILYHQCRSFVPASAEEFLDQKHSTELFYYYNRVALFERVTSALSKAEIPFFTVKGLDVAQFYPVPALRTMGDCDIIVHSEDKEKAHEVMMTLGFENRSKAESEWEYFKDGMEFEVHDHLLYVEGSNSPMSRRFTDSAWDYALPSGNDSRYELDWSFHFLFLLMHLKKHLINNGVGFRQFMDLDVVIRRCPLNWDWIGDSLAELELGDFTQICYALMWRWFETPLPFEVCDLDEDFYLSATKKVFGNGIFGFQIESNREYGPQNELVTKPGPRWLARTRRLAKSVFPSYRNMRFVPHYAFLNGRPWLLPYAWVYRFWFAARNSMGANGKRMINNVLISDEKLDAREQELAKWGLLPVRRNTRD